MPTYKYQGVSPNGVKVSGVVTAADEKSAVFKIKESCAVVYKMEEQRSRDLGELFADRKIKLKVLSLVCNQFSIILGAGVPIVRSVRLVAEQTDDKRFRRILELVAEDVTAGKGLADSFADRGKALPTTFIETIRAGEESGNLEVAFKRLSNYYDKATKTRGRAVSAMIYPIIVILVAVIVVAVIMIYAVPTFSKTFAAMGTELPIYTRILIGLSDFLLEYGVFVLLGLMVITVAVKFYSGTERGREQFARMALKLPIAGRINLMTAASQYANTMSTMLAAGLPMATALRITSNSISNFVMGRAIRDCAGGVESGRRLSDCLREKKEFPELIAEMTTVGEETGELEMSLATIAEFYDNEVQLAVDRAISMLEPITIVFLALIVGVILLAVYMPMFDMYGTVM